MFSTITHSINTRRHLSMKGLAYTVMLILSLQFSIANFTACSPEPPLHLYDGGDGAMTLIFTKLDLDVYWDYQLEMGVQYDWRAEWFYDWDEEDERTFGPIDYNPLPNIFNLYRYFTANTPYGPHDHLVKNTIEGTTFRGLFQWGFWDVLVFNEPQLREGVQSIVFDEGSTLDSVTAYTHESMSASRHHAPRFTRAFYQPEALFTAYEQGIDINRELTGFEYDSLQNIWIKKMNMILRPITYIYLTQLIVHNNNNKIVGVEGSATLSGMARSTTLNSGKGGTDAIDVTFNTRWKKDRNVRGENVDIAGGKLMTFGICNQQCNKINSIHEVKDDNDHFMDIKLLFNNGMDSTFVFNVTEQVRRRYKGGVLTVEIDMDTIQVPTRSGGSAFDAVVKDFVEEQHEIEM